MSGSANILWLGLGLIGVAFLAPSLRPSAAPPEPTSKPPSVQASAAETQAGNGFASRTVERAPDGHFYLDAQVNGAPVHFLVDTGASMVVLTPADAQRAGIPLSSERIQARGAGGIVEVTPVRIERLAAGPLEARGIQGAVARELPVSLLGQSFLARVGTVEISGDHLTLR